MEKTTNIRFEPIPGLQEEEQKFYRHYKGGLYRVLQIARHTETGERLVIYQALYGAGGIWARPWDMFYGEVDTAEYKGPRFAEISPTEK